MRIGIFALPETTGPASLDTLIQQVTQAEKDGFDSFWFAHHSSAGFEPLTMISLAGRETSRIELGTAVVPIFSCHTISLAQHASTAQVAAGGRLALGIGLSHKVVIEDIMGLSYNRPARHMREYLSILWRLINHGQVDFAGQVFNVEARLQLTGSSPFPILIAAHAPRMLRIAGELAAGTISWMAGRKTVETHIVPRINASSESTGRPQPRVCVALPIVVTDDHVSAREHIARSLEGAGRLPTYRRLLDIEGVEGPADVAVIGNEVEVGRQLRALRDAGATDFVASIFPDGEDTSASVSRTWAFLKTLKSNP